MRDATEAKHWFTTEEQSRLASERLQQAAAAEQVQTGQFSCTVASCSRSVCVGGPSDGNTQENSGTVCGAEGGDCH